MCAIYRTISYVEGAVYAPALLGLVLLGRYKKRWVESIVQVMPEVFYIISTSRSLVDIALAAFGALDEELALANFKITKGPVVAERIGVATLVHRVVASGANAGGSVALLLMGRTPESVGALNSKAGGPWAAYVRWSASNGWAISLILSVVAFRVGRDLFVLKTVVPDYPVVEMCAAIAFGAVTTASTCIFARPAVLLRWFRDVSVPVPNGSRPGKPPGARGKGNATHPEPRSQPSQSVLRVGGSQRLISGGASRATVQTPWRRALRLLRALKAAILCNLIVVVLILFYTPSALAEDGWAGAAGLPLVNVLVVSLITLLRLVFEVQYFLLLEQLRQAGATAGPGGVAPGGDEGDRRKSLSRVVVSGAENSSESGESRPTRGRRRLPRTSTRGGLALRARARSCQDDADGCPPGETSVAETPPEGAQREGVAARRGEGAGQEPTPPTGAAIPRSLSIAKK